MLMNYVITGTAQEQFIKYLKETPQYTCGATESTSNKMVISLIEYVAGQFNWSF
jgi:hypothetical protein